jgi:hypothetical protein
MRRYFEIRDRNTFVPVLAVRLRDDPSENSWKERYLLRRCGYSIDGSVLLTRLDGSGKATSDPYDWADRTFATAHHHILEHWDELETGDVVDVEFILGETTEPKVSEGGPIPFPQ